MFGPLLVETFDVINGINFEVNNVFAHKVALMAIEA